MGFVVSDHQLKKAIKKLAERGIVMEGDIDRRDVAQMIAQVQDKPIPKDGREYSGLIWDFLSGGNTPTAEPRPFQPLNYAKAMGAVLERINPDRETKHSAGRMFNPWGKHDR